MDRAAPPTAHGVFKPVGHVVLSFPTSDDQAAAARALAQHGFGEEAVTAYSDAQMRAQAMADLESASSLATIGQEVNLVKAHLALADEGFHFLVVEAQDDALARRVAEIARPFRAERAQRYGRFVIEELIEHPQDEPQMAESPDRGLDAQTPTGLEAERAWRRRAARG